MATSTRRKLFTNFKLENAGTVDIKLSEDKQTPYATGCVFMSNGLLIVCDSSNHKVKVLEARKFTMKEALNMQSRPWDISVVDQNNVIVTLPDKQELQFLQVSPQLQSGRALKLDKRCWGVEVVSQNLYVTCHGGFGEGEVRILDMDGNTIRRLGVGQDETFLFKCPFHLTVSALSGNIYVSDSYKPSVTCLLSDGNVHYEYKDPEISGDRGLCVDCEDNIMLCGQASDKVQIITPRGKKHSTLLSSRDGIDSPTALAIDDNQTTLIVGREKLFVFKIR